MEDPKVRMIKEHIDGLIRRLERWVSDQKRFVSELERFGEYISTNEDRLSLLYSAQAMLMYIERTLKDFETWLNNPVITSIMPMDLLKELEERLRKIVIDFVKLDIDHTSKYTELLRKLSTEPKVPEILKLYFEQKVAHMARETGTERREMPRFL